MTQMQEALDEVQSTKQENQDLKRMIEELKQTLAAERDRHEKQMNAMKEAEEETKKEL